MEKSGLSTSHQQKAGEANIQDQNEDSAYGRDVKGILISVFS